MTLKDMMLGSAIAALVAGGAIAQTADSSATDSDSATEMPIENSDSTSGDQSGTEMETETEAETDSSEDSSSMSESTDSSESMSETDSGSTDAGAAMAPESDATADSGDATTTEADAAESEEETMTTGSEEAAEMEEGPTSLEEMTVDQVVGTNVVGVDDESVGEIDYVVEQTDGLAFVIGIGGFLGLGEYTVAIPADQFSMNADGDLVLSSMTKEDLEALPEFDESGVEGLDGELVIGDLMTQ